MILFRSDWARYPNAIADYQTQNRSFVKLALVYKNMGIQNHSFHLSLMQPELVGVNPHDPDLPLDVRAKIALECKYNPWYYFREVVRLPPHGGVEPIQFRANRGNIALFWSFFNHIDAANIQPRQTGKSASTDCLMVALLYLLSEHTRIMLITKDDQLRQANIERIKSIRDYLPPWLYVLSSDDRDNQKEVTCEHRRNKYSTGVARSSESAASNLGRGMSVPILQVDEGPYVSHIETTMRAALVAGNAARAEAARNNQHYGNIFTTTAGKIDDRDGRYMYNFIMGGTVWSEPFLDCRNLRELRLMVERNAGKVLEEERKGKRLLNITMSHLQLGYDDKWLYRTMMENDLHGEDADRDLLNIWTRGSRRSPLSLTLNEAILHSEMEVQYTQVSTEGYMIRWYVPEDQLEDYMARNQFVLSMDTSEAVGRDAIAMTLLNLEDLSVVAVGTYNETNIRRFADFLADFIIRHKNVTTIIERKSTGQAIYDMLVLRLVAVGEDPFRRLYNKIVNDFMEDERSFEELSRPVRLRDERFYEKRKTSFGFLPTAQTRLLLYTTILQNAAKRAGHLVRDKTLSSELRHLVEKNGRIDHTTSGHDDHVIAWLIGHWFVSHAKNLQYYGIDVNRVMTVLGRDGKAVTDEEREEQQRQKEYNAEFEEVMEELKRCNDHITALQLEHRLKVLSERIQVSDSNVERVSIDAMIRQAADERRKRARLSVNRARQPRHEGLGMFGTALSFGQNRAPPSYYSHY